jgi:hypothetical protein
MPRSHRPPAQASGRSRRPCLKEHNRLAVALLRTEGSLGELSVDVAGEHVDRLVMVVRVEDSLVDIFG